MAQKPRKIVYEVKRASYATNNETNDAYSTPIPIEGILTFSYEEDGEPLKIGAEGRKDWMIFPTELETNCTITLRALDEDFEVDAMGTKVLPNGIRAKNAQPRKSVGFQFISSEYNADTDQKLRVLHVISSLSVGATSFTLTGDGQDPEPEFEIPCAMSYKAFNKDSSNATLVYYQYKELEDGSNKDYFDNEEYLNKFLTLDYAPAVGANLES